MMLLLLFGSFFLLLALACPPASIMWSAAIP